MLAAFFGRYFDKQLRKKGYEKLGNVIGDGVILQGIPLCTILYLYLDK